MFNFIAAALLDYLLVEVLKPPGAMDPATAKFPASTHLPTFQDMLQLWRETRVPRRPCQCDILLRFGCLFRRLASDLAHALGYAIRAYGHSEPAALYAGISPTRIIMIAMLISGGLSGMMAINNGDGRGRTTGSELGRRGRVHRDRGGLDGAIASAWRAFWLLFCLGFSIRVARSLRFGPTCREN